jgi:hypothetical protein
MANAYPFDDTRRIQVARLLYQALPLFYRVQDQPPLGQLQLRDFLRVLAAPLATLRQSIEELQANFFIDTCSDAALPLLAQLIGNDLLFPDADTNRRDLRGTVSRRKRKGTRPMLEELGRELSGQLTVVNEGWQRLSVVHSLNIGRQPRTLADVRPITFGATATGPLDAQLHLVDIRAISAQTGRYHPKHLTHWVHLTSTFPVQDGTAHFAIDSVPDPILPTTTRREWRYTFHPLGHDWPLRQRPTHDGDFVGTDRILAELFARRPADFFGVDGRFVIRIAGLPAGIPAQSSESRTAVPLEAHLEVADGTVNLELVDRPLNGWSAGQFTLSLCLVHRLADGTPDTEGSEQPVEVRSTLLLGQGTSVGVTTNQFDPATNTRIALLRLTPTIGNRGFFPGATVVVTGERASAARAHPDPVLNSQGFLRGALPVALPATHVDGPRWFFLAADGSLFDAQSAGVGPADVNFLDPARRTAVGPGAAWPPLTPASLISPITKIPPTPGHGPNVLHGGHVLLPEPSASPVPGDATSGTECALVFAMGHDDLTFRYRPVGRLHWFGPDPSSARWQLLDDAGVLVPDASIAARLAELAAFRRAGPTNLVLGVRFECSINATLTPAEVSWPADDGGALLIYLPELPNDGTLDAPPADPFWPTTASLVSNVVHASDNGSTHEPGGSLLRLGEGQVTPLRGTVAHLRRRVKWQDLSAPPGTPSPAQLVVAEHCLSVDVELGRFSFNGEAPQAWPPGPFASPPTDFVPPPNVTVAFEDAYSAHVGARPLARDIVLIQLGQTSSAPPTPTRLVSRSGTAHASFDPALYQTPRYTTLNDALAAIASAPSADELATGAVVQFEDDATYPGETLSWPNRPLPSLTIRAVDTRRPVLQVSTNPASSASYDSLTLEGIAFGGAPITLPLCKRVDLEFCTVTTTSAALTIPLEAEGTCRVTRSITAALDVTGDATLEIRDSVVDAGASSTPAVAVHGPNTFLDAERSTFIGTVGADGDGIRILEASECLFADPVFVVDRFEGCIRFSAIRLGGVSVLPRRHELFAIPETTGARFLSNDRLDATHVRLSDDSPSPIRTRAEDGSEVGVFKHVQLTRRLNALEQRLSESTPAGLVWALLRVN